MSLLGLLVIGATAAYGSQADQPKMNGKLKVTTLSPEEVRYTGKPYNKELGAYVFNGRNYDAEINRWTTSDPTGFPDGANNRVYSDNNATSAFDPTGYDTNYIVDFSGSQTWVLNGTGVGSGKNTLNPSDGGQFKYTINAAGTHFVGQANGAWSNIPQGAWAVTNNTTHNSWTVTEGGILQSNKGTDSQVDNHGNPTGWQRDWITVSAYFILTSVVNGVTTKDTKLSAEQTFYGGWYE